MVRDNNNRVSVAAFERVCQDFEKRFTKIEQSIAKLKEALDKKTKNKVSVAAWDKSLADINAKIDNLFTSNFEKIISDLNEKLDNSTELINELMIHLNEKVSISAWERSCMDLEKLSSEVRSLKASFDEIKTRFVKIENDFKKSLVNEKEVKEWLKSL